MPDKFLEDLQISEEERNHFILLRKDGPIGYVIMNRSEKLNALPGTTMGGPSFAEAFRDMDADNDVKVVIFKGLGRAFSAGGDVSRIGREYEGKRLSQREFLSADVHGVYRTWESIFGCHKVVISEGKGYVVGFAMELFLAADIYICAEDTLFFYPPARMIGHQGNNVVYSMMRLGPGLHAELYMMGRTISAKELYERGAINRVVAREFLEDTVRAAAEAVCCQPADGLYIGKLNKRIAYEAMGSTVSGLASAMQHTMQVQQRLGQGEFNLFKERAEHGAKEAWRIRDERLANALKRYMEH